MKTQRRNRLFKKKYNHIIETSNCLISSLHNKIVSITQLNCFNEVERNRFEDYTPINCNSLAATTNPTNSRNKIKQLKHILKNTQIGQIYNPRLPRAAGSLLPGSELTHRVQAELEVSPAKLESTSMGEVANLLQRSRKEANVVEVEAEAEDDVEAVVMDEVGILTAATSTTTRKEKAQQEAAGEAIQTRGTINLKEEPSLTIEVRVSSSSAIPLIRKVTSYTTRTTKSL
ncbi:hypothetical protein ACOSQ3_020958 [Xanthoceras sorbifolium]